MGLYRFWLPHRWKRIPRIDEFVCCNERANSQVRNYFNIWANAAESWNQIQSRDYPGYTRMARSLRESSFEAMRKNGNVAIGCPDRIIEYIYWLSEKLDIDCILWQIDFGAMPGRAARRTLIAFADDVLPKFSCGEQILTTTCNV